MGELPKQQEQEEEKASPSKDLFRLPHNIFQHRKERISTSSDYLDAILGGGLELGEITQFYGGPATGKTHLCHTVCVALPDRHQAIYIDTEGGFREDKLKAITDARNVDWNRLRQKIIVARPGNSDELEKSIEELSLLLTKPGSIRIKLLIIDSLMFHYRKEYPGRSGLSKRSHRLNILMYNLRSLAKSYGLAVLITNQCSVRKQNEDPQPFGGNIVSHLSTYIIYLDRTGRSIVCPEIMAKSVKNPISGSRYYKLAITPDGFNYMEDHNPLNSWEAHARLSHNLWVEANRKGLCNNQNGSASQEK